jgi:hypothetical protein
LKYLLPIAALGLAGCAWIAGVSGDVGVASPDPNDAAALDDGARPSEGGDAGSDAISSDGDGGASADGADLPEGGRAPNAAAVACGTTDCANRAQVCCYSPGMSAGCQSATQPTCTGAVAHCDESIDCDPGQVCCVLSVHPYGVDTACRSACDTKEPQACRTSSECPSGKPCATWRCASGIVETCGGMGSDAGCLP